MDTFFSETSLHSENSLYYYFLRFIFLMLAVSSFYWWYLWLSLSPLSFPISFACSTIRLDLWNGTSWCHKYILVNWFNNLLLKSKSIRGIFAYFPKKKSLIKPTVIHQSCHASVRYETWSTCLVKYVINVCNLRSQLQDYCLIWELNNCCNPEDSKC